MAAGGRTSLWWDMESCPLPSSSDPFMVTVMASTLLRRFNIIDVKAGGGGCSPHDHYYFFAYEYLSQTETELDQMLINSGIRLQQPPPGNVSEIEKMITADVLLWAMDTPHPAYIVFIVGNVDLSYLFEKLRQRSYNVFLVSPSGIQVPQGMLNAAKGCLEWLSFLRSLEIEIQQLNFRSANVWSSVHDCTFSNAAVPNSSSSIHNKEPEESQNRSGFTYGLENSFRLPYFSGGWNSTNDASLNETGRSSVQPDAGFQGPFTTKEEPKRPPLLPSPTEEPKRPPLLPSPTEKPKRLPSLPSTTEKKSPRKIPSPSMTNVRKKKSGTFKEFEGWLSGVINSEEYAETGYNISGIRKDFERATGKILDEQPLGFRKVIDLVEECKDVAVLKQVRKGCHVAFPVVKRNKQNGPGPSPLWASPTSKPKTEMDPRLKLKASLDDFKKYIHQMVFAGQFSQGFLLSTLPQNFEERTGKLLDVKHLGYEKLSELVASNSHLVSVKGSGRGPVRLFPADFISQAVSNNSQCNTTSKETSMNTHYGGSKELKEKVEVYSISFGGSDKGLAENITPKENISDEHSFCINYVDLVCPMVELESELLPSMSLTSTKAKAESRFQEHSIKSDSSDSQVSEWEEGQSSVSSSGDFDPEAEAYAFILSNQSFLDNMTSNSLDPEAEAYAFILSNQSFLDNRTSNSLDPERIVF